MARSILSVGIGILFLAACVVLLGYTGRDDSHITYFVSDALAEGRGLINYNGVRLEQSSSLLFALILGGVGWLTGLPAAATGYFVSLAFLLFSMALSALLLRRAHAKPALAVIALCVPPAVYWALSGMENSLYLLLLVGLVLSVAPQEPAARGRPVPAAFLGALITLVRPEGVLVVFSALAFGLVVDPALRAGWRASAAAAAGAVLAIGGRIAAGLSIFPNTVYAKGDLSLSSRLLGGEHYWQKTFESLPVSSVFAAFGFLLVVWRWSGLRREDAARPILVLLIGIVLAIGFFALFSGGDWMEYGRFFAAAFALLMLSVTIALRNVSAAPVALLLAAVFAADMRGLVHYAYGGIPAYAQWPYKAENYRPAAMEHRNVVHARDLPFIDHFLAVLKHDARDEITVASAQAGMVPYYVIRASGKHIRFVDLKGLSTADVLPCRGDLGWDYRPYQNLVRLERCIGLHFDYVFDLDGKGWHRASVLEAQGCRPLLKDTTVVDAVDWKPPVTWRQFLARCD